MSREIEFRVWDPSEHKIYYNMDVTFFCSESWTAGYMDPGGAYSPSDLCQEDGAILMQYIGLKDICDKKAYVDDIIKFDDTEIGCNKEHGRIFYCVNLLLVPAPGYYLELSNGRVLARFPFNFQIIGNIYENPELLAE